MCASRAQQENIEFVKADVSEYMKALLTEGRTYDVVVGANMQQRRCAHLASHVASRMPIPRSPTLLFISTSQDWLVVLTLVCRSWTLQSSPPPVRVWTAQESSAWTPQFRSSAQRSMHRTHLYMDP